LRSDTRALRYGRELRPGDLAIPDPRPDAAVSPGDHVFLANQVGVLHQTIGDQSPLVRGSTGQLVTNPLLKRVDVLDGKILELEDRFGGSPMALLRLQVTFGDAARSLAELNATVAARVEADDEASAPRLFISAAPLRESPADDRRVAAADIRAVGGALDRSVPRPRRG